MIDTFAAFTAAFVAWVLAAASFENSEFSSFKAETFQEIFFSKYPVIQSLHFPMWSKVLDLSKAC